MNRRQNMRQIDRDKVRANARKLDGTGLLVWLDRAIDMLPEEAFPEFIADYVHLKDVVSDGKTQPDPTQRNVGPAEPCGVLQETHMALVMTKATTILDKHDRSYYFTIDV